MLPGPQTRILRKVAGQMMRLLLYCYCPQMSGQWEHLTLSADLELYLHIIFTVTGNLGMGGEIHTVGFQHHLYVAGVVFGVVQDSRLFHQVLYFHNNAR